MRSCFKITRGAATQKWSPPPHVGGCVGESPVIAPVCVLSFQLGIGGSRRSFQTDSCPAMPSGMIRLCSLIFGYVRICSLDRKKGRRSGQGNFRQANQSGIILISLLGNKLQISSLMVMCGFLSAGRDATALRQARRPPLQQKEFFPNEPKRRASADSKIFELIIAVGGICCKK
jgi:hypothetical protein